MSRLASAFTFGTVLPSALARRLRSRDHHRCRWSGPRSARRRRGACGPGHKRSAVQPADRGADRGCPGGADPRSAHRRGLADTADGPRLLRAAPARWRRKDGGAGPFGVAAVVLVLPHQAAAFTALTGTTATVATVSAVAAGRVAAVLASRRGVPAPRAAAWARGPPAASRRGRRRWTALVAQFAPRWPRRDPAGPLAVAPDWWRRRLIHHRAPLRAASPATS